MITIEIGASYATLLKLAADIQKSCATTEGEGIDHVLAAENNEGGGEGLVRFSNEDMERPEVADAVYVEILRH